MHIAWVVVEKEHHISSFAAFAVFQLIPRSLQLSSLSSFALMQSIISITVFQSQTRKSELLLRSCLPGTP
jgi:hypothetical protein